jgi:hypothetical protein
MPLVYWKKYANFLMFHVQPFLQCLSRTQSHSKVILHNVYDRPLLHTVSLESIFYTQFHEKPILQTDFWGKSAVHCFTKSPFCSLINRKHILHNDSRKAYYAIHEKPALHLKLEETLSCTQISKKRF